MQYFLLYRYNIQLASLQIIFSKFPLQAHGVSSSIINSWLGYEALHITFLKFFHVDTYYLFCTLTTLNFTYCIAKFEFLKETHKNYFT
jgi:hypothetical protein